jgi:diguanylate cyclase (GGDEF)-like protein
MARLLPGDGCDGEDEEGSGFIRVRRSVLSKLGVFVKDFESPEESFPSQVWMSLGYGITEMEGDRWLEKVHPDDHDRALGLADRLSREGFDHGYDRYRVQDSTGRWHWLISTGASDSFLPDGSPRRYFGLDLDITSFYAVHEELLHARELAEKRALEAESLRTAGAVIASSLTTEDAIFRVVAELRTLLPVETVLVYEERDRKLRLVQSERVESRGLDTDSALAARTLFEEGVGKDILIDVMRNRTPEVFREPTRAAAFWLAIPLVARGEVFGATVVGRSDGRDFDGGEIRLAMAVGDYLALALNNARLYEKVRDLARTDQLSRLLTRRALFEEGVQLIRETADGGTSRLSCIILDIDHFKQVNDRYGHQVGDEVIRRVANVCRDALRGGDVVGRYGGEEFCALLPGLTLSEARGVAERICSTVRELEISSVPAGVTASLGVAVLDRSSPIASSGDAPDPSSFLDNLMGRADVALYRAKNSGRDRVETAS